MHLFVGGWKSRESGAVLFNALRCGWALGLTVEHDDVVRGLFRLIRLLLFFMAMVGNLCFLTLKNGILSDTCPQTLNNALLLNILQI